MIVPLLLTLLATRQEPFDYPYTVNVVSPDELVRGTSPTPPGLQDMVQGDVLTLKPDSRTTIKDRYNHVIQVEGNVKTVLLAEGPVTVGGVTQGGLQIVEGAINVRYAGPFVPILTVKDSNTKIFGLVSRFRRRPATGRRIIVRVKNTTTAPRGTHFWIKRQGDTARVYNFPGEATVSIYKPDQRTLSVPAGSSKPVDL